LLQAIRQSPNYKWWAFGVIGVGTFFSVVDTGSVMVALPDIERHFDTDLATVQWVVVGYALAISVLLLPMGRLGDIVGRKKVYLAGIVIFVIAAGLAGASRWINLPTLIGAKVIQGVGSAMLQATGMAILMSIFPANERGKVLGSQLSVVGAGAIAGPALGGPLVSFLGWQWVFFIHVPVGIITIALTLFLLEGDRRARETDGPPVTFDWPGAVLSAAALLVILLVVGSGNRAGWTSPAILAGAVGSVAFLAAFIWWELRAASPMLELRLFKRKLVALGVAAGWISFLGSSAARFMMPFYLQRVLLYSPWEVSLIIIPAAVAMVVVGPLSGRLSDRFGWRNLTVGGLMLGAAAWLVLASSLSQDTSLVLIVTMLTLQSFALGMFFTPNDSSIFSAVERSSYGVVSALTQLTRNSANVTSIAVATTVIVTTMAAKGVEPSLDAVSPLVADAFLAGLRLSFWLMAGIFMVGVVICLIRGERVEQPAAPAEPARVRESTPGDSGG
jgi:EmrB/QacA subfamily drug resistance transporter